MTSTTTVVRDPAKVKFVYREGLFSGADILSIGVASRSVTESFSIFLPALEREFSGSRSALTLIYSLTLVINGLGAPIAGWIVDRFGVRMLPILGMTLTALATASASFATDELANAWVDQETTNKSWGEVGTYTVEIIDDLEAAHDLIARHAERSIAAFEGRLDELGRKAEGVDGKVQSLADREALVQAVHAHGADLGIALDGDADRLQMVDAQGRLYNGDELLYILADDRLGRDEVVPGVVGTLMTNMAIEQALTQRGVDFVRAKVGDRYVLEALAEKGWLLGGEGSGHLLVLDQHSTGDGIVSALQVLTACVRRGCGLADLLQGITLYPQHMINVRLANGVDWTTHAGLAQARAQVEQQLAGRGRVLIRASGTEPVLRIMVEAQQAEMAQRCAQAMAQALQ